MMANAVVVVVVVVLFTLLWTPIPVSTYNISKAEGLGRRFDGVGALSAGTCSALLDYDAATYVQVMDYLFLPGFGASLQILKVEIGVDVQSTDGTQASHMHPPDDENYARG